MRNLAERGFVFAQPAERGLRWCVTGEVSASRGVAICLQFCVIQHLGFASFANLPDSAMKYYCEHLWCQRNDEEAYP